MKIPLTRGRFALVDDEDYEFLMQWKWTCSSRGYAVRMESKGKEGGRRIRKAIYMHRIINNTPEGLITDHINRLQLDNRKENLRISTNSQNQMNTDKVEKYTSKYKGVRKVNRKKLWRAQIGINGKYIFLGSFSSEEEAALAYNLAAIKYFGDFAKLNEI